jgi:hypothetical protein
MAPESHSHLRFRGTPLRLECIATLDRPHTGAAGVVLNLGGRLGEHRSHLFLLRTPGVGALRMRFALPVTTPAGTYRGAAFVDSIEYPITAEVDPQPNLVASPSQLEMRAAPGATVQTELMLLNKGNVACEVGKAFVFRLFDDDSVDRGLGAALGEETEKGRGRIDRFIDEVVAVHGGPVRVAVGKGTGTIQPGEHRELGLSFRFSDKLVPGRDYYGFLSLYNLHYTVRVHAAEGNQ